MECWRCELEEDWRRVELALYGEDEMASLIEIKGLGAAITSARAGIKGVREAAANVQISADALTAELNDVHTQIEAARSDLKFEAQTLGNSGASNGAGSLTGGEIKPVAAKPTETAGLPEVKGA